jgi:hypothetical protein
MALAKDATAVGDTILAESYLQHAEHYQRIINSFAEEYRDSPRPVVQPFGTGDQPGTKPDVEDDLALPISILGGNLQQPSQNAAEDSSFPVRPAMESVE